MRLLKCYGTCGEKHPKTELTKYKNLNYCITCYRDKMKNDQERQDLLNVISSVYDIPYPTGFMLRQMKQFKEDRNYSYGDQAKAILYSKNILNKVMKSNYGLGLIPYVIEDAKKYYTDQERRMDEMEGKELQHASNVIKKLDVEFDKDAKRKEKLFNMEDILK